MNDVNQHERHEEHEEHTDREVHEHEQDGHVCLHCRVAELLRDFIIAHGNTTKAASSAVSAVGRVMAEMFAAKDDITERTEDIIAFHLLVFTETNKVRLDPDFWEARAAAERRQANRSE